MECDVKYCNFGNKMGPKKSSIQFLNAIFLFFYFQRAVLNYVPETIGWGTIAAIMSVAAVSVVTAFFLARKQ